MQSETFYTPASTQTRYNTSTSEIPIPPPLPGAGTESVSTTTTYAPTSGILESTRRPEFAQTIPPGMPAPMRVETVTPFPESLIPIQSSMTHPPAVPLTQQTTSATYQPTMTTSSLSYLPVTFSTYSPPATSYLTQYNTPTVVTTQMPQPVTQPVFVTETPAAVQTSPLTVSTSTTYVAPMEVIKAKIVNDLLLLYSGRPSQECFDNYAHNAVMNSPFARGVNKPGIEATFASIPHFFTYWQVMNYSVNTTAAPDKIYIDYNIRYNWRGGSKKRLHEMISHVVLTLDPHGKILSHEEVWEEGFGYKRKPNKGVSKLQQWISDAGGRIANAFGETRRFDSRMTGWNEAHSNRPPPNTFYTK